MWLLNESCLWCYQHRRLHIFFSVKKNDVFFRGSVDVNQKWSSAGLFEKLCCLESNSGDGKDETPPAVSRHRFSSGIETLSGVRLITLALIEQAHLCINTYMHRKTGLVQPSGQRSVLDKKKSRSEPCKGNPWTMITVPLSKTLNTWGKLLQGEHPCIITWRHQVQ